MISYSEGSIFDFITLVPVDNRAKAGLFIPSLWLHIVFIYCYYMLWISRWVNAPQIVWMCCFVWAFKRKNPSTLPVCQSLRRSPTCWCVCQGCYALSNKGSLCRTCQHSSDIECSIVDVQETTTTIPFSLIVWGLQPGQSWKMSLGVNASILLTPDCRNQSMWGDLAPHKSMSRQDQHGDYLPWNWQTSAFFLLFPWIQISSLQSWISWHLTLLIGVDWDTRVLNLLFWSYP